jgi:hypothetical protein
MKTTKKIGAVLAAVGLSLLTVGSDAQGKDKGRSHASSHAKSNNGKHLGWSKGQHKGWSKSSNRTSKDDRDWRDRDDRDWRDRDYRKTDWRRDRDNRNWRKTNTRNTSWRLIDTDYYRTRARALKEASNSRERGLRANVYYDSRRQRWVVREYRRY